MTLTPGAMIGRYRVDAKLGQGGMGEVYRAHDTVLNRGVALKILHQDRLDANDGERRAEFEARFEREARAAAASQHPNAIAIFDFGSLEGRLFIAMELVDGGRPLRALIGDPSVPMWTRTRWLHELAHALSAVHRAGLVHRDVKPENVMITREDSVKLLDFGIARRFTAADPEAATLDPAPALSFRTISGGVYGTPRYMAPEQRRGGAIDARVDQYAWAVVAYELLVGAHPLAVASSQSAETGRPPPIQQNAPSLPFILASVIDRALHPDPAGRYASLAEVARAIEPALNREAFSAAPTVALAEGTGLAPSIGLAPQRPPPSTAPPKSNALTWILAAGGGLLVLGLVATAVIVFVLRREPVAIAAPDAAADATAPAHVASPVAAAIPAGRFCWVDLGTSNAPAALTFYTQLLGWTSRSDVFPAVPGYTAVAKGDQVVGAIYKQTVAGVPPVWSSYVAVASADAALARAKSLGGVTVVPAFDAAGLGRAAGVRDPSGAVIGVLQVTERSPARVSNGLCASGAPCWNELWTDTSGKSAPFYRDLFGWTATAPDKGYSLFSLETGGPAIAGTLGVDRGKATVRAWTVYFAVDDTDAVTKRASSLGATVIVPATNVPGIGRYAVVKDPQGAVFAILRQQ